MSRDMSSTSIHRTTRLTRSSARSQSQKLRAVSPEELLSWADEEADSSLDDGEELDDGWPYKFQVGEHVWIRTAGGKWHQGKVSGRARKGITRQTREGLFYPVIFQNRIRKYFAPLNGDIKPDTPHIVDLLRAGGWI